MAEPSGFQPGMLALRNAVENVSIHAVTDEQIAAILRGEDGRASHVRAVFGDAALATIAAAGRSNGIDLATILAAYAVARDTHAAANRQLDAALDELRRYPATPPGS